MRRYRYVGPPETAAAAASQPAGSAIVTADDARAFYEHAHDRGPDGSAIATYVVDEDGVLRLAPRRSEHVACAGGRDVLAAGEMWIDVADGATSVTEVSNHSTGFCPPSDCWPAVAAALEAAGVAHPGGFTTEVTFRRCRGCGQRNIVKDSIFECDVCGAELDREWNFDG